MAFVDHFNPFVEPGPMFKTYIDACLAYVIRASVSSFISLNHLSHQQAWQG